MRCGDRLDAMRLAGMERALPTSARQESAEKGRVLKLHPDEPVSLATTAKALSAPAEPDLA